MMGELRDLETIDSAMTVCEDGSLGVRHLHTNGAISTITRIVNVFPRNNKTASARN